MEAVRKFFSIAVAFVYLILSVGVAKSTHFCMGRALPSAVFFFESDKCGCSELSTPDDCCDDQLEIVKIDDDQSAGSVLHSPAPEFNFIGELFSVSAQNFVRPISVDFVADRNLPPPKVPIYQKVCSLVFYESVI